MIATLVRVSELVEELFGIGKKQLLKADHVGGVDLAVKIGVLKPMSIRCSTPAQEREHVHRRTEAVPTGNGDALVAQRPAVSNSPGFGSDCRTQSKAAFITGSASFPYSP